MVSELFSCQPEGKFSGSMESIRDIFDENLKRIASLKYILQYQEYLALGDEVCAALSFQYYYTINYGSLPNDLDKGLFKRHGVDTRN